eukprot:TRINITY_DN37498_c0_g1_i1.p1 TRINITY_DN37498_c0_g1~~TRINITY_DN37498_c0_g1_i1.p1  ORF type:complete len:215 (-),score=5.82 TRINITY_DN37498_c0_g1_i1:71-715(-)
MYIEKCSTMLVCDKSHRHSSGRTVCVIYFTDHRHARGSLNSSAGAAMTAGPVTSPFTGSWVPLPSERSSVDVLRRDAQRSKIEPCSRPDFSTITCPSEMPSSSWNDIHVRFRHRGPIALAMAMFSKRARSYREELGKLLALGRGPDLNYDALFGLCQEFFLRVLDDARQRFPEEIHSLMTKNAEREAVYTAGFALGFPMVCVGASDSAGLSVDT